MSAFSAPPGLPLLTNSGGPSPSPTTLSRGLCLFGYPVVQSFVGCTLDDPALFFEPVGAFTPATGSRGRFHALSRLNPACCLRTNH